MASEEGSDAFEHDDAPSPDEYSLDDLDDGSAVGRCCACGSRRTTAGDAEMVNVVKGSSYLGSRRTIMVKFVIFSVSFSLNHACVTGVLSYAQVFFPIIAQVSIATLYGVFTGTALLLATIVVEWATYKYALFFSLVLYSLYVTSYAVGGAFMGGYEVPVIMTGAVVGGLAAGFLWTAQGPYFKAFAAEVGNCLRARCVMRVRGVARGSCCCCCFC
jgi:hypothetical protein